MDCQSTNCNVSGNERMISCWLCLGTYHLKCSGLKARDADALADHTKSLQWNCPRCKNINIEFYKFFKSYKEQFDQLNMDFLVMQSKLSNFGALFSNFPNLDKFADAQPNSSPKRKKSTKTPIPSITISKTAPPTSVENDYEVITTNNTLQLDRNNNSPTPTFSSASSLISYNIEPTQAARELRAIPPRKTIFATRFLLDTTVDDVKNYLQSKFDNNLPSNLNVFKINSRNRASFKIIVPLEYFDQVVNVDFWPKHTMVREFIYRDENLARIPTSSQIPKN